MKRILSPLLFIAITLGHAGCGDRPGSVDEPATSRDGAGRPNVVLVIIDTLRADYLGCYGRSPSPSPELDELAGRGVRFARTVSQSTWTRPSIGSTLTSLHPRTLGLYREAGEVLAETFITLPEVLQRVGYTTLGVTANPNINSFYNFDQGFDEYRDTEVVFEWMPRREGQAVRGDDEWLPTADEVVESLLEMVDRRPGASPTYLQANLMDVHEYQDDQLALPPEVLPLFPERAKHPRLRRYLQAIRASSIAIERLVRELAERPGWERTLIVVTSDHGETLGEHPALGHPRGGHGWLVYESQTLVPLILAATDDSLPPGLVVERPVRLLDLMPTILDLVGAPTPPGIGGVSLTPLLADPDSEIGLPSGFVVETQFRTADKIAVYEGDWSYVENRDGQQGTDPVELQRAGHAANGAETSMADRHPEEVQRLAELLRAWEQAHPSMPPTMAGEGESEALVEQLRSLGYVD